MMYQAVATLDNGKTLAFELERYQVEDFVAAVYNRLVYTDAKTGVISWLPTDKLHHLLVKPYQESPICQNPPSLDLEEDLLTSPNQ